MKRLVLLILSLLPMAVAAQESGLPKWSIVPSYGIMYYGNTHPFNKVQYAGLTVGYEFAATWSIEASGIYGFGGNAAHNAVLSIDKRLGTGLVFIYDIFIGLGYQYANGIGDMLTTPIKLRATAPITRNFMIGLEYVTAVNSKDAALVSNRAGIFLSLKF